MKNILVLQILGNSDVKYVQGTDTKDRGSDILSGCHHLQDIKESLSLLKEDHQSSLSTLEFPIIKQLQEDLSQKYPNTQIYWGIILTDQTPWMQMQIEKQNIGAEGWSNIIATDGIWWEDFLSEWFINQNQSHFFIKLSLDPSTENENGVANWDQMAKIISPLLEEKIHLKNQQIEIKPTVEIKPTTKPPTTLQQIIIQHSSGTPALSSALYLWGLEKKLAGYPIRFAYLANNEITQKTSTHLHKGSHWQWRLKKPQVLQLLQAQNFSGAIALLGSDCPKPQTLTNLEKLDNLASLNLQACNPNLSAQDDVLERIAIALWTESNLRRTGQWANWILRTAGAIELALLCLVKHQGQDFQWSRGKLKSILYHPQAPDYGFVMEAKKITQELLTQGTHQGYVVNKITDLNWENFTRFYCKPQGWVLSPSETTAFCYARNDLYHSLAGDRLDQLLDQQTKKLSKADHPQHPAQVAITHLWYLLNLANLKTDVSDRLQTLRRTEKETLNALEELA
jgi:hypothetical protein